MNNIMNKQSVSNKFFYHINYNWFWKKKIKYNSNLYDLQHLYKIDNTIYIYTDYIEHHYIYIKNNLLHM